MTAVMHCVFHGLCGCGRIRRRKKRIRLYGRGRSSKSKKRQGCSYNLHALMPFPDDIFFSCLGLDEAYLYPNGVARVNHEISVSAQPPVQLDEAWVRALGTIQAEKFGESGLFI